MCMCTQVCACIYIILSVNAASSHSSHRKKKKKKDDTGRGRAGGVVTRVFRRGRAKEQLNYSLQKKKKFATTNTLACTDRDALFEYLLA